MNISKADRDAELELANHIFSGLEINHTINVGLQRANEEKRLNTMPFSDLMRAILAPEKNEETLELISNNLQARKQMTEALRALSAAHNPSQAAAANGSLIFRDSKDFSMKLTFSARGDGAAYLEITFSDLFDMNVDSQNQHLYCLFREGVCIKKLPAFESRSAVLLLDGDDTMIGAFQDHKAEFFIR